MPPIVLTLLQGLLLLLLYIFVYRAVRAVWRDLAVAPRPRAPAPRRQQPPPSARNRPSGRALPRELVVHRPDGQAQVLQLNGHEVTLGRAPGSTVRLNDPYVSDNHARVYEDSGQWLVADTGSTNGTYLNRSKVSAPAPLAAGDEIALGKTIIEVRR